ncbi:hypothetical protein D9M72_505860 [compost metagenome]
MIATAGGEFRPALRTPRLYRPGLPGQTHAATKRAEITTDFCLWGAGEDKFVPARTLIRMVRLPCSHGGNIPTAWHLSAQIVVFRGNRPSGPVEEGIPVVEAVDRRFVEAMHDHGLAALLIGERLATL